MLQSNAARTDNVIPNIEETLPGYTHLDTSITESKGGNSIDTASDVSTSYEDLIPADLTTYNEVANTIKDNILNEVGYPEAEKPSDLQNIASDQTLDSQNDDPDEDLVNNEDTKNDGK